MSTALMPVIDGDAHMSEPPDLWTSRLPKKYAERGPRVLRNPDTGEDRWFLADRWLSKPAQFGRTAGHQDERSFPKTWEEVDPACWDPKRRLAWMDANGIYAQVIYPNFVALEGFALMALKDLELEVALIRCYNDYLLEAAAVAPDRFVLLASVPFWNREEAIKEMERCAALGFRGVLWAATLDRHGLPTFYDEYWDPFYARAQDLNMSINFHVGVGYTEEGVNKAIIRKGLEFDPSDTVYRVSIGFQSNARTIAKLVLFGVCHRFPRLQFVSVESGFGFVPFLVEAMDWQWLHADGPTHKPERLMPSEYFRRQISTMFWFEQSTLSQLPDWADNVMFETDFPHNTCLTRDSRLSPDPIQLVKDHTARFGEDVVSKVMWKNAARVYGVDMSKAGAGR